MGTPTCHSISSYSIPFHLTALLPPSVPQSRNIDLVNGSLTTTRTSDTCRPDWWQSRFGFPPRGQNLRGHHPADHSEHFACGSRQHSRFTGTYRGALAPDRLTAGTTDKQPLAVQRPSPHYRLLSEQPYSTSINSKLDACDRCRSYLHAALNMSFHYRHNLDSRYYAQIVMIIYDKTKYIERTCNPNKRYMYEQITNI